MTIQSTMAATETKSCSQVKATLAPLDSDKNARHKKILNKLTETQGMPKRLVLVKIFGARPSLAIPYRMRDPASILAFPELQALVRMTALMMDGTTLMPALEAAMTKGDWEAVPVDFNR